MATQAICVLLGETVKGVIRFEQAEVVNFSRIFFEKSLITPNRSHRMLLGLSAFSRVILFLFYFLFPEWTGSRQG